MAVKVTREEVVRAMEGEMQLMKNARDQMSEFDSCIRKMVSVVGYSRVLRKYGLHLAIVGVVEKWDVVLEEVLAGLKGG